MKSKGKIILATAVAASMPFACSKKKEKSSTTATASDVQNLGLSGALSVKIPDSMATATGGTAASLRAVGNALRLTGNKSMEACMTMTETKMILTQLDMISKSFCHFEAEGLKFGTKYNIDMGSGGGGGGGGAPGDMPPGGPGLNAVDATKMQLWIDDAAADYLHVYMCQSGKLAQHFKVKKGSVAGQPEGSMEMAFSQTGMSGGASLKFDLSKAGTKKVTAAMQFKMDMGGQTGTFSNFADIKLVDDGVNEILMSKKGSFGTETFADRSMLAFNGTKGQVAYKNGQFSTVSTFGADGNTVDNSEASEDIKIDVTKLPNELASTWEPAAPEGWDCSGADTELTISASTGAAHQACEDSSQPTFPDDCSGSGFGQGTTATIPDKEPLADPDAIEVPAIEE